LYARAKALFDLVAPQEYGIDMADKEEIGVLTSLPLLRKIVEILVEAKETSSSTAQFFFTKSVHLLPHFPTWAHSLSTESRISKLSCTFC
jgi:inositol hexakisphosphate/diphosphoinositol-pentakisphosphate kinase